MVGIFAIIHAFLRSRLKHIRQSLPGSFGSY